MRITILASGSSGNSTLIESGDTRVLVDAGIGSRALARRLQVTGSNGLPQAIIVTHSHADHVAHCARLSRRLRIPVYASEATERAAALGSNVRRMGSREPFAIGALTVFPLPVPHDVPQVALVFDDGKHRVALVTDVGEVTPALLDHVADCDALLLESNHDSGMLERGPYPETLKRRIASARGHLSNAQACELLRALGASPRAVVLMHLSETNNLPDVARRAAFRALGRRDVTVQVAHQREPVVVGLASAGVGAQLSLPGTS